MTQEKKPILIVSKFYDSNKNGEIDERGMVCVVREIETDSDFESELPNWSLGKKRVFVEEKK